MRSLGTSFDRVSIVRVCIVRVSVVRVSVVRSFPLTIPIRNHGGSPHLVWGARTRRRQTGQGHVLVVRSLPPWFPFVPVRSRSFHCSFHRACVCVVPRSHIERPATGPLRFSPGSMRTLDLFYAPRVQGGTKRPRSRWVACVGVLKEHTGSCGNCPRKDSANCNSY